MISFSTRGRLAATAAAITISTIGWLSISSVPPPTPGGGGSGYAIPQSYDKNEFEERRKKIKQNGQDFMLFIKIFTEQCQ